MPHRKQSDKGHSLVELSLVIPILLMLLLGVAEGGNAISQYMTIIEVSREAARLVVREGSSANIVDLAQQVVQPRLNPSFLNLNSSIQTDSFGEKKVSVEVTYDYQFMFASAPLVRQLFDYPLRLRATTVMPVP